MNETISWLSRFMPAAGAAVAMIAAGAAASAAPADGAARSGFAPQSVTFISASQGWVLGLAPCHPAPCTAVVHTRDGGRTWHRIPAPGAPLVPVGLGARAGVSELRFADASNGWAYGPDVYLTHNGGAIWHKIRMPGPVLDLEAAAGVAYAAVKNRHGNTALYRSTVGRNRWSLVPGLGNIPGAAAEGSITLHGSAGWLLVGNLIVGITLLRTSTGANWTHMHDPCGTVMGAGLFPASIAADTARQVSMLCVSTPASGSTLKKVYSSADGGRHFTAAGEPPSGGLDAMLARPTSVHLFVAAASVFSWIYASGNAGRTWHTVLQNDRGGDTMLNDFGFTTSTQGVVVQGLPQNGGRAVLRMTRNGGRTWPQVRF